MITSIGFLKKIKYCSTTRTNFDRNLALISNIGLKLDRTENGSNQFWDRPNFKSGCRSKLIWHRTLGRSFKHQHYTKLRKKVSRRTYPRLNGELCLLFFFDFQLFKLDFFYVIFHHALIHAYTRNNKINL